MDSAEHAPLLVAAIAWAAMDPVRTVRLTKEVAAMVDRGAAAAGWMLSSGSTTLARALFVEKLDEVQAGNRQPLTEDEAAEVVYGR